ncbi:MAG: hypothetical protein AABX29_00805 [Nanoarchaeota archaeon]
MVHNKRDGWIYERITAKKEFSHLIRKDVEKAWGIFEKRQVSEEEKIRLVRDLLRKVFSAFTSQKLLSIKHKDEEWILKKHLSTRERFEHYNEIYSRILKKLPTKISVIDLGAGVNGISYKYFKQIGFSVNYIAVDGVGQLVKLMNHYFSIKRVNAKAYHESLFELEKIKEIIKKTKKPRVIFLFKTLDSLEMLERDYSKKLLKEIAPLMDRVVVSFATRSMVKRERFRVSRNWILSFIKENFKIINDFEIGGERYVVFKT